MAKKKSYPVKPIWVVHLYEDSYFVEEVRSPGDLCLTDVLDAVIADLDSRAEHDDSEEKGFSA